MTDRRLRFAVLMDHTFSAYQEEIRVGTDRYFAEADIDSVYFSLGNLDQFNADSRIREIFFDFITPAEFDGMRCRTGGFPGKQYGKTGHHGRSPDQVNETFIHVASLEKVVKYGYISSVNGENEKSLLTRKSTRKKSSDAPRIRWRGPVSVEFPINTKNRWPAVVILPPKENAAWSG